MLTLYTHRVIVARPEGGTITMNIWKYTHIEWQSVAEHGKHGEQANNDE